MSARQSQPRSDGHRGVGRRRRLASVAAAVALAAAALVGTDAVPASGEPAAVAGTVESGGVGLAGYDVALMATDGTAAPVTLGTATTGADGRYGLTYEPDPASNRVLYLTATPSATATAPSAAVLASVLGTEPIGPEHVVNPVTTVGTAYGMAQFLDGGAMAGPSPGLQNAVSMTRNLFDPVSGSSGAVLVDRANTGTETLATFNSLSNLVAGCVDAAAACDALLASTTPDGGPAPTSTLLALDNLVHDPSHDAAELYAQSLAVPETYSPARAVPVAAWTLALRFDGDGTTLNGPGNFAVDHEGNVWTLNNYTWNPKPEGPACSSKELIKFLPNGQFAPGTPITGGGISGAGFGIDIDPYGDVWTSNFGFASTNCTEYTPHDSVSQFRSDGTPVSPDATGTGPGETGGYIVGGLDWPQAIVSDGKGTMWVANCQGNSVTLIPEGDPSRARELTGLGLLKPLDIAFDRAGTVFVTGTESDNVAVLAPDGTPTRDPLTGFSRPMGIASNSDGHQWVSNSRLIDLPCPNKDVRNEGDPYLSFIDGDQNVTSYAGGGLFIPWGIAVDGDDNVWVANFGSKRLSAFCGRDGSDACPEGAGRGTPLSPEVGYPFDGLVRNTGVAIDPSGNVWLTNNWKETPFPTNPGGFQVVVYVGLASPVQPPAPIERPTPPEPPTPPAPPTPVPTPAIAVPGSPRYTG